MVPIFVGYALVTWYLTATHRRQVVGALSVVAGLAGLILLNWLHIKLGQWTDGEIFVPVLQTITYPYSVLVVAVGVFIFCIPRKADLECARCRYSLAGLDPREGVMVCPECGMKNPMRTAYRRSGVDRESFSTTDDSQNIQGAHEGPGSGSVPTGDQYQLATDHAIGSTEAENSQRQTADQRPTQQA